MVGSSLSRDNARGPGCARRLGLAFLEAATVHPVEQVGRPLDLLFRDPPGCLQARLGPFCDLFRSRVDPHQWRALGDAVTDGCFDGQARTVVDLVFLPTPATADVDHRQPAGQRVDAAYPSLAVRPNRDGGAMRDRWMLAAPALSLQHLPELSFAVTAFDGRRRIRFPPRQ